MKMARVEIGWRLCVLFFLLGAPAGRAQVLTALDTFNNGAAGGNPGGMIQGTDGNFYGSAVNGGTNAWGALFEFSAAKGITPLYSFNAGDDGANPGAALTQGTNGLFYGVAESAGANGSGTIFNVSSGGAFSPLYSFARLRPKAELLTNDDGAAPVCALTLGANGNFYGTAPEGGINSYGTIFEVTHQGKVTVLYAFSNSIDGASPEAPLLQFTNGNLYGTAYAGGSNGYGTIFGLTEAGKVTPLYSFTNGADGSSPQGALIDGRDGNLYGTCSGGGLNGAGTIFKVTTTGALTPLYSFTATSQDPPYYNNDGASPRTLVLGTDGNLYGTAYAGGTNGAGAIFEFGQSVGLTPLYSFSYLDSTGVVSVNSDGGEPRSLLQTGSGVFYGATYSGGSNGYGTIFRIAVPPQISVQPSDQAVSLNSTASFSVTATGALAYQWQFDNTNISGATTDTLDIEKVTATNAGYYQVVLTNDNGATVSSTATLGITNAPVSFGTGAGALSYKGGQVSLELTNLLRQGVVVIDASSDLTDWEPISTNPPGFGVMQVIDSDAAAYSNRFYRARTQ